MFYLHNDCRTQEGPADTWDLNFHAFSRSFVSLDQNLIPTQLLRDKGTKGQQDKGTKGQRHKGTKGQRDKRTKG